MERVPSAALTPAQRSEIAWAAAATWGPARPRQKARDRFLVEAHSWAMFSSAECLAKSGIASATAADTTDIESRVHFELIAAQWAEVAIMAEWQDEWMCEHPDAQLGNQPLLAD